MSSMVTSGSWTPQQVCCRKLLVALRDAYSHDRSRLFWGRHRALLEFHRYAGLQSPTDVSHCLNIGEEVATFVAINMKVNAQRIHEHNEVMMSLPVDQAKRFREQFLVKEAEHESWCKQKVKTILLRRPPPPYPFC